jgi:hypothetical protein
VSTLPWAGLLPHSAVDSEAPNEEVANLLESPVPSLEQEQEVQLDQSSSQSETM